MGSMGISYSVIKEFGLKDCIYYIDIANSLSYPSSGTVIENLTIAYPNIFTHSDIIGSPTINSDNIEFVGGTTPKYICADHTGSSLPNCTAGFSFGGWVKPNNTITITGESVGVYNHAAGQKFLFWPCNPSSDQQTIGLSVGTNGVQVFERSSDVGYVGCLLSTGTGGVSIPDDEYTHIMITFYDKYPKLYINGVYIKQGIQNLGGSNSLQGMRLGGGYASSETYTGSTNPTDGEYGYQGTQLGQFSGNLAMAYVFKKCLSDQEVALLHASHKNRFVIPQDSDVTAFLTATGITDETIVSALETLVDSLKTNSLWDKMKAIYPLVGGTATTHKYNLKDPRDLDAAYRLTYTTGTQTHSSNGIQGDAVGYVSTNISPSSHLTITDTHVSCYVQNLNSQTALAVDICSYRTATNIYFGLYKNGSNVFSHLPGNLSNGRLSASVASQLGFFNSTRTSLTSHKIYRNGSSIASDTTTATNSLQTDNIYLLGLPYGYRSSKVYSFFTVGTGLTDTDASNLYSAVQAFQTALGRNV